MSYVFINGTRYTVSPYVPETHDEEVADRQTVMEFDKCDRDGLTATWDRDVFMESLTCVADAEVRLAQQAAFRVEEMYGVGAFTADRLLNDGIAP